MAAENRVAGGRRREWPRAVPDAFVDGSRELLSRTRREFFGDDKKAVRASEGRSGHDRNATSIDRQRDDHSRHGGGIELLLRIALRDLPVQRRARKIEQSRGIRAAP